MGWGGLYSRWGLRDTAHRQRGCSPPPPPPLARPTTAGGCTADSRGLPGWRCGVVRRRPRATHVWPGKRAAAQEGGCGQQAQAGHWSPPGGGSGQEQPVPTEFRMQRAGVTEWQMVRGWFLPKHRSPRRTPGAHLRWLTDGTVTRAGSPLTGRTFGGAGAAICRANGLPLLPSATETRPLVDLGGVPAQNSACKSRWTSTTSMTWSGSTLASAMVRSRFTNQAELLPIDSTFRTMSIMASCCCWDTPSAAGSDSCGGWDGCGGCGDGDGGVADLDGVGGVGCNNNACNGSCWREAAAGRNAGSGPGLGAAATGGAGGRLMPCRRSGAQSGSAQVRPVGRGGARHMQITERGYSRAIAFSNCTVLGPCSQLH